MLSPEVAYDPLRWSSFLSAEVGASAALTGLLFVAISINLSKIIALPNLTSRAAKALVTLMGVLFAASLCLVPGQSTPVRGSELVLVGLCVWITVTLLQRASSRNNPYVNAANKTLHWILTQVSAAPLVLCGVSLLCSRGGGLYWLLVGVLVSFATALLDAWVLLIEIQR